MCRLSGLHAIALLAALTCLGSAPLSAQAPAGQESPDPALLGDWRCDEGEGDVLADSSGRGNDGDIRGAEWVKGRFGTALYFGGRDAYVSVPGVPGLDGSNEMTVSAWVYWEKSGRYPNIISSGNWCPGGFLIFVADTGCSFRMGKPGKAPLLGADWAETSATLGQVKPGEWVYLTATFRRPTIETYVNGKRVGTATWDYPVGFSGNLQIGTWGNAQSCHTGMIDEVRLYKRALSAAEVAAAYAAGAATHAAAGPGEAAYVKIPAPPAQPAFTLENKLTRVALDRRGRVVAFVDKAAGQDHCARPPMDFVTIKRAGVTYRPSACTYRAGVLDFTFGKSGLTAQVKVTPKDRYFVLELVSVSDPEADEMVFGALAVSPAKRLSGSVAWAADDDFAVAVVPLNLQVEVGLAGGALRPTFLPRCVRKYGLVGARTALVGSPTKTVREVLKTVVRTEGLPNSPVGGPFALDAEQNRGSYLFATVSEKNVDEWIALGRRGGFDEIHLCPWWWKMGHYEPHPDLFPHGMAGLKQVVARLHAAGFKVGMHTLTGCIQVDDPWVSPVPDSRLTKDAHFTLAAAVGPDDKFIPTIERPEGLKTFWSDVSTGNTIQIGEEIIAYRGLAQEPPYGFTDCTRGQWKTRAAAHDKGSGADHLVASYCCYFPDENSTLLDEMAQRIADVFNACGTDMIYMDGSEGMRTAHAVAKMKRAIFTRLKGQTMVESSSGSWGAWPFHSRVGAWDHPLWGFNRFTDLHCASLEKHSASEMLPGHMGWWVITGPAPDHAGMFPEDMEYFCGKCLGWDYSMSLEGVAAGARPPNARQDEYLTMLGRYERLRLARYFPEAVRAKLRTPGEQFRLAQAPDGAWQLRPTDYAAHRITSLTDGTQGWTMTNRFAAQPARLRIEALYACAPYDSPDAVVLSDFSRPDDFGVKVTAQGITQQLTTATEGVRGGATGGCLTAKNATADRRGAWTKLGRVFTPPLNMARCGALGVWVYGDGKGELLNFQLNNCPEYYTAWDDHYVDVNFTGWRYFELLLRERDAQRHQDYVWPYGGPCEVGRTPLQRGRVGAFNIYTNDLPPGETVQCTIGPVKALPALKVRLNNPTVTIGGKRLVFPVSLESGQYIEYEGPDDCCVRDERGEIIARVTPQGDAPVLAAGDNALAFACDQPEGCQARARVTVISQGAPLAGVAPKQAVDWRKLRTEYDAPRTIQALDGRQNQWTMACRPGVKSAVFQVDLVVERTTGRPGTPEEAKPLLIEGCENAAGFADTPDNKYTQYVYDGEVHGVAAKPGVTVKLEPIGNPVKAGQGALRLSATSTRGDSGGWCARGRRFATPLNLTDYSALGCWVYGDAGGQSLKLQLRDTAGGWQDMVTPVDFTGWKRVEFPLGGRATINLSQVQYLIVFFNGIPSGRTVSCCLDEIQALRDSGHVSRPAFTVNGKTLTFPVTMGAGERLAYSGSGEATVYGRDGLARQRCRPEGSALTLKPGANLVCFSFDSRSVGDFSLRVQVVKQYPQ